VLSSSPLLGWGKEAALKILEMTAGRFPVVSETYLGLRHGPMSFLRPDTLVLCLLSSDPTRRLYEIDLVRELRAKKLGYLVGIGGPDGADESFDEVVPAVLPDTTDDLRTPFEILIPQLLGYHLSLRLGLNPDNPSPEGVISRVVQGVKIHSAP
jgi:tagatose-6-phosphate ketose/aldose isomerase